MDNQNFYITTTLPYLNGEPHIGFAAEIIRADVLARFAKQRGSEVFFNTGTDEHGLKIYRKALEEGLEPQAYCDELASKFFDLKESLNLSYDSFIRTTDPKHIAAAQEFWKRCETNGDIYKKKYQVKYCVGCELEKTDSDLVDGRCPLHPNLEIELIDEDNYFFKFSKYQQPLLDFYADHPDFVVPEHRFTEIKNFIESGLQDFSISRLKSKMPWGVEVPNDTEQVMYVWFDALVNYISCLGWPENEAQFNKFWPGLQVCGKDNLRQQTAMWQAMLMSAGLPNSKQVLIFGFIAANGQKMSKSLGNVINPKDLVEKYGTDPVRYYLLSEIPTFADGDYSEEKFQFKYNADLANGLGNLAARCSNLIEKNGLKFELQADPALSDQGFWQNFNTKMTGYHLNEALQVIFAKVKESDEFLSAKTPWKLTDKDEIAAVLKPVAQNLLNIAIALEPFLPKTGERLRAQFSAPEIKKGESLFPRLA
jgi:methionyl-tRNA synthetase